MNYLANKATFYAVAYSNLKATALQYGYALTLHGSLQKDLDVVAIPWIEEASNIETLVKALCDSIGGFILEKECTSKPHGRQCYIIHLGGEGGYIDLSVIPPLKK